MNEDVFAYLLHEMTEEERQAFCQKWMSDADLHEQLRMVEAELLDAYVRDDVNPERRRRIETYLLASERQRQKLAFARQLHQRLARERRTMPWYGWTAAACLLALAGAAAWLARENGNLQRQVLEARVQPPTAPPAGAPFLLTLPSGQVRGAGSEIRAAIPAQTEVVRLELEMNPADRSADAAIEVSRAGRVVWSQTPLSEQPRGNKLIATAWIPAAALVPGRYEIKLSAGASALAYYDLTIGK